VIEPRHGVIMKRGSGQPEGRGHVYGADAIDTSALAQVDCLRAFPKEVV
jgi:hypothetical protein